MTRGVRVAAAWTWRILVILAGIVVLAKILQAVELVAFAFALALLLTSVLHPVEAWLRRHVPGPRALSALLALLLGLIVVGAIGFFVVEQISAHADQLGNDFTDSFDKLQHWLQHGPLHLDSSAVSNLSKNITATLRANKGVIFSGAVQTVQTVVDVLASLLLILLSLFFLLRDGESIWGWTVRLFPRAAQPSLDYAARQGWHTLSRYVRGQVTIALFHGITVMILLFVLQTPLAAALGVVIFLGSFVPILGLLVAGALCTVLAGISDGLTAAIIVAVAITILVQIEGNVLQPLIMSRALEIHPLAVAVSVLAGTALAGIVGALLAVPLVSFVNATVIALRSRDRPGHAEPVPPPSDPDPPSDPPSDPPDELNGPPPGTGGQESGG